jgi:hypothetical protein
METQSNYYTAEHLPKFLEGPVSEKLVLTEMEIDDMVSKFALPKGSLQANFQITMTYVPKANPHMVLEMYSATAPNLNAPYNTGIANGKGIWIERYPRNDGSTYFNIYTITKGNENVPEDYSIQAGDIIDLHPTTIMGDTNTFM